MKKIKSAFLICALSVLCLVILECLASLALSFVKKQPEHVYQYSYMTNYVYDPYVAFRMHNFPAYGNLNTSDKSSVVITGGSTAVGVGVHNWDKMYFNLLDKNLRKLNLINDNQMINYGVPGYVSNQEAAVYREYIFDRIPAPKALISFTSFNDIYFYLFRTLDIGNHEFSYSIDLVFRKGYPDPDAFTDRIKNFVRKSNIFTLGYAFFGPKIDGEPVPIRLASDIHDPYQARPEPRELAVIQKAAKNFLDNCLSVAVLAKYRGTKYIVLIQPTYYYGGELTVKENQWFNEMSKLEHWIQDVARQKQAYDKFFEIVFAGLAEYKKQGLLDYWDYRDILKEAGPVYLDPVHYNETGSEIVANKMTVDLKKYLTRVR